MMRMRRKRTLFYGEIMRLSAKLLLLVLLLLPVQVNIGRADDVARFSGPQSSKLSDSRQILFLNTYPIGLPIPDSIDRGLLAAIKAGGGSIKDVFIEHLDLTGNYGDDYRLRLADLLRRKLAAKSIGVVITEGAPALQFLATEGRDLFADAALLTLITPDIGPALARSDRVLDIPWQVDPAGTLNLALELFPETRRVLVVTGADDQILPFLDQARKAFEPWLDSLDFEYSNQMTYEQMLKRVSSLPEKSIVIYSPFFSDITGRTFVPAEVVVKVSQVASAPVFATLDEYLGKGIVGGALLKTENIGRQAGQVALDYLRGRLKPEQPVTTFSADMERTIDWTVLQRWRKNSKVLPEDALIINRPVTLSEQYRKTVIVAGIVFIALAILILVLWSFNRRLKRLMALAGDSEERYRILMENAPEAIIVYDLEKNSVADANPKAAKLFGCPREILLGEDPARFFHVVEGRSDSEEIDRHQSRAMAGEEVIFERSIRTYDGKNVLCEIRLAKLPFRKQRMLRASFVDISQRKLAEEALHRSEAHLRTLVQTIPDLIWLKDKNGVYLSCNQMFERFFGASEADIVGKTDYDFVDREQADFFRLHDRKAIAAGKPSSNEEWITFADDGRRVLLEATKTPMYDSRGNFVGVLGIGHDITERKKAEEQRTELEAQLLQSQKLEAIGQLAGGVAHDFNNMLAVIIGYTELSLEQVDRNEPLYHDLKEIQTAAIRSAEITRQLLAFARKQTVAPEPVDLNKKVGVLLKMLQRLIGEDIELSWRPGNGLWMIRIDPGQLDQIMANLCVNARGAISGIGRIIVSTENVALDESYCASHAGLAPGEYVLLTVSDDGCGMSQETISRIFEPFFTTKAVGEGTGLGLAMVYGAVKQNNGFIDVASEMGKGTIFSLYFPKHQEKSLEVQAKETAKPVLGGKETILLVEDQANLLAMAQIMLQELGYKVLAAQGPREAIRLAQNSQEEVDLLITDVIMPEMNGRDLVDAVLVDKPDLKYLFMSGYSADILSPGGDLGDKVRFLQKPFSKSELDTKIRETLH